MTSPSLSWRPLVPAGPRRGVLADLLPGARVRDAALVLGGAGLTGIAAQIAIHTGLTPVPFTLQTLAVLLVGAALGPWRGAASLALYAAAGSLGVPWFADHAHGWAYGPSFGYIVGFVLAALAVGFLSRRGGDRNVLTTALIMVLGDAILLAVGTAWLAIDLGVSLRQAYDWGVQPFLIGDALKLSLAALLLPATWRLVRR
jgi:biotin transport system substrate-specific component